MEQLLSNRVRQVSTQGPKAVVTGIFTLLLSWQERSEERYRLKQISDHTLRDIGLSRADIDHEVRKPFWRG